MDEIRFISCFNRIHYNFRVELIRRRLFELFFSMILSPISWFISAEITIQRYRSVIYCVCFSILNVLITVTNSVCMLTFKVSFFINLYSEFRLENWILDVYSPIYCSLHIVPGFSIQISARDTRR